MLKFMCMYTDGKTKYVFFPSKKEFIEWTFMEGDHLVEWTEIK